MKGCFAAFSCGFFAINLMLLVEKKSSHALCWLDSSFKVKHFLACCSIRQLHRELFSPPSMLI